MIEPGSQYVKDVLRTEAPPEGALARLNIRELHAVLGLVTEVCEIADLFSRQFEHRKDEFQDKAVKELGDAHWYFGVWADVLGISLNPGEEMAGHLIELLEVYAADIADLYKKQLFYGTMNAGGYIGSMMMLYKIVCAIGTQILGVSPEEVQAQNIEKLRARYPEKFDETLAQNHTGD